MKSCFLVRGSCKFKTMARDKDNMRKATFNAELSLAPFAVSFIFRRKTATQFLFTTIFLNIKT